MQLRNPDAPEIFRFLRSPVLAGRGIASNSKKVGGWGRERMGVVWQTAKAAAVGAARKSHRSPLLRWLVSLGGLGLFAVGIADSSVIPLPLPGSTDLLLLLLTSQRRTTVPMAVWMAFCAIAGSLVGGYLTWGAGHKGGEMALERYVPERFRKRIAGLVEKHGVWSVALATILPPPVPLTPFLLAAGALGMARGRFMLSFGTARVVRYSLLAWLGIAYGRHFVHLWEKELNGWSTPILWTYAGLVVLGVAYGIWKTHRRGQTPRVGAPAEETV
jgi:membrane protein YqaA with SNARE-associated domain